MSERYSVYVLSPERRFVIGLKDKKAAMEEARSIARSWKTDSRGHRVESAEVWDNHKQLPVYGVERVYGGRLNERYELPDT